MKNIMYISILGMRIDVAALVAGAIVVFSTGDAMAHGAVGVPIARQYQCRLDGGYDYPPDGSGIHADGCRTTYQRGYNSSYPFLQWNEVAANPEGQGSNQQELEMAVPNGLLCAGGDPKKAGLDLAPAALWPKTTVTPKQGKIEVRWDNTQAHNPAVMRIYLSKQSYDLSQPLKWSDLDKIYEASAPEPDPAHGEGHLPGVTTFYHLSVPIPRDRHGPAVLFSYWQRIDSSNEGFFNCSDINIVRAETEGGFPWIDAARYVDLGFSPKIGESVRFRVMGGSARGDEVVDVQHTITARNLSPMIWAQELANILNSQYGAVVQIGVRSGNYIQYVEGDLTVNRVWLKPGYSSAMNIVGGVLPAARKQRPR